MSSNSKSQKLIRRRGWWAIVFLLALAIAAIWFFVFTPSGPILIIHNRTDDVLHDVRLILSDAEITIGDMKPDQQIQFRRDDLSGMKLLATRKNGTKVELKHGMGGLESELESFTMNVTPDKMGSTYEFLLSTRLSGRWHAYWRKFTTPKPPVASTTAAP